jgi:hypothetical protein
MSTERIVARTVWCLSQERYCPRRTRRLVRPSASRGAAKEVHDPKMRHSRHIVGRMECSFRRTRFLNSFAAPRLVFERTFQPHGSRRGLYSRAAPRLCTKLVLRTCALSEPGPHRCKPTREAQPTENRQRITRRQPRDAINSARCPITPSPPDPSVLLPRSRNG